MGEKSAVFPKLLNIFNLVALIFLFLLIHFYHSSVGDVGELSLSCKASQKLKAKNVKSNNFEEKIKSQKHEASCGDSQILKAEVEFFSAFVWLFVCFFLRI